MAVSTTNELLSSEKLRCRVWRAFWCHCSFQDNPCLQIKLCSVCKKPVLMRSFGDIVYHYKRQHPNVELPSYFDNPPGKRKELNEKSPTKSCSENGSPSSRQAIVCTLYDITLTVNYIYWINTQSFPLKFWFNSIDSITWQSCWRWWRWWHHYIVFVWCYQSLSAPETNKTVSREKLSSQFQNKIWLHRTLQRVACCRLNTMSDLCSSNSCSESKQIWAPLPTEASKPKSPLQIWN